MQRNPTSAPPQAGQAPQHSTAYSFLIISHYIPDYPKIPIYTNRDISGYMTNTDHEGYRKIQCWVPQETWDKIEPLGYPNQTSAVTEAFDLLLSKSQNIPNESQDIPELKVTISGLQLLLQEKDDRIQDLHRETETLSAFAHYFKSLEYRRLEASTEEIKHLCTQEPEEKPAREPRRAHAVKGEKALIKKTCKNCGEEFETYNSKKETCSDKCRASFFRRKK